MDRQADDLPSLKDETICDELPPHLLKVPTGIVGTAIDADTRCALARDVTKPVRLCRWTVDKF